VTVSNAHPDAKSSRAEAALRGQPTLLYKPNRTESLAEQRPDPLTNQQVKRGRTDAPSRQKGKLELKKGEDLMKTTMKSNRRTPVLLSILCTGLVVTFLGGCAEGPYVAAYDTGYYPAGYYTPYSYDYYYGYPYSYYYYGPTYRRTIVRYGDWY
jgi:hypothetical protein